MCVLLLSDSEELYISAVNKNRGLYIVHGFQPESESFDSGKKRILSERASQGEHNGAI